MLLVGIVYCNGAHASTEAVADMALYFIIAVFRNMKWSSEAAQSNDADQFEIAHREVPAASRNPCGHTLGIVGLGNIGFAIAQKVKPALAMNIIYYDVIRKDKNKENSIGAEFCPSLSELLQRSDCVLIATPHSETPILNDTTLGLLPRGARVVNIARGSVVDESALARALDTGHISAAAMDVHQDEPRVNRRLSRRQNVIMTCHTGGGTMETNIGFERLAIENVDLVLKGRAPKTPVNSVEVGARPILGPKEKHKMLDDVESIAAKRQHVDS